MQLAATTDAPAHARAVVAASMGADPRSEVAALAVSELVTNALRHGDLDPDDSIGLLVLPQGEKGVRIEVHNRAAAPVSRGDLAAGAHHDVGGWGLGIVGALSTGWGVDAGADGRTVVWFTL